MIAEALTTLSAAQHAEVLTRQRQVTVEQLKHDARMFSILESFVLKSDRYVKKHLGVVRIELWQRLVQSFLARLFDVLLLTVKRATEEVADLLGECGVGLLDLSRYAIVILPQSPVIRRLLDTLFEALLSALPVLAGHLCLRLKVPCLSSSGL